jgi:hypothetical protein
MGIVCVCKGASWEGRGLTIIKLEFYAEPTVSKTSESQRTRTVGELFGGIAGLIAFVGGLFKGEWRGWV